MSAQVLNILKYFLLALVWLFFLRILRVVWVEIRSGGTATEEGAGPLRAGVVPALRRPTRPAAPAAPAAAASAPAPMPMPSRLRVVDPADRAGQQYSLRPRSGRDEVVIGRSSSCDVPLGEDSFVSSNHARVFARSGVLWLEDMGSTNGTLVNAARVATPVQLRPGDRIQIGRTTLEVET